MNAKEMYDLAQEYPKPHICPRLWNMILSSAAKGKVALHVRKLEPEFKEYLEQNGFNIFASEYPDLQYRISWDQNER